eukprot:scaffold81762_cov24-Phaeocystis_antarctica.AAC.1
MPRALCAAALLRHGGVGCVGVGDERGRLRTVAPLPRGRAAAPFRRRAALPPRGRLPALGSHASRQGSERSCGGGGAGCDG